MSDTGLLDTGPLDAGPADEGALDTGPLDAPAEPDSARATITPREAWRKARLPLALGALLAFVAVLQALTRGGYNPAYLDPTATGQDGSRALAELLRDRGVRVIEVDGPSGSVDVTVFVPIPELIAPDVLASASEAADLVLVAPGGEHSRATGTGVVPRSEREAAISKPGCEHPDAVAAGDARVVGVRYRAPEGAAVCYGTSFVEVTGERQRVTFLGTGELMTNEHLDENGNAALALRLLTRHPTVEWVYPRSPVASGEEPRSLGDLVTRRVNVFVWELVVVALLLAAWRARRLGPVVVEPLPVVVRAAESVEGRARLYQAARARGRAADAVRAGLRDRLVRTLGLAPDAARSTLVEAVTVRTRGRDPLAVDTLLYGPPPRDDTDLVRLADDLDSLYSEVRDL